VKHTNKYGKYEYTVWGEQYACDDCWFPVEIITTKSFNKTASAWEYAIECEELSSVIIEFCLVKDKKKESYPIYRLCPWTEEETFSRTHTESD
jgi:hypothetical protein